MDKCFQDPGREFEVRQCGAFPSSYQFDRIIADIAQQS